MKATNAISVSRVVIADVAAEVRRRMVGEWSGHDWWHIHRVWNMAERLGREEGADMTVVALAALLYDIADWKFHDGDVDIGPATARKMLEAYRVPEKATAHVCDIIAHLSYKGAGVPTPMATIEGKCVQDADRLDAIGAIGIARTFAYGGHKNRLIHDPERLPELHATKEKYLASDGGTINHFHEKLLLLKDRMNTETARSIALGRQRIHGGISEAIPRGMGERFVHSRYHDVIPGRDPGSRCGSRADGVQNLDFRRRGNDHEN